PASSFEGYLFPDTYTFPDNATARDAVRVMVERFEKVWKPEWTARAAEVKMSRHEVLTLASIVEREVFRNDERPVVAAVYLNRLKAHIPLQADPTVQYALGKKPGRVLYRDLRVVSPYNTYLNPGLPPGPIASPGAASIEAALHPAKVPYRFFVAAPDGHHEFRRTFAEHEAAIAMVRAQKAAITAAEGLAASRAERTLKTAPDSTVKTPKDSATKRP
ncbi:MAG: endolytic transglycosylase MltG, partial [Betaproteobacteria bacterium]|nr:endolytic transglycosylase MltG [Betaproteobacteria bacterium]